MSLKRISLRVDPDLFDKLDAKRFRARDSFQRIGMQLWERWLGGEGEGGARASEIERLARQAAASLPKEDLGVIEGMLRMALRNSRASGQ